jgi:hypothetical protein
LYDVPSGTWNNTGALHTARAFHTATLLLNGKVLVAGGLTDSGFATNSELYDPASGTWTVTGALSVGRYYHTATLLPSGQVLVAGGLSTNADTTVAEIYDPGTGLWSTATPAMRDHEQATATLLASGQVLVAGSFSGQFQPSSAIELYNPIDETWTFLNATNFPGRYGGTATLLPNGHLLVAGGASGTALETNLETLYDVGLGFSNSWQPQIATVTSQVNLSNNLAMTGSQFRPSAEGSGGNGCQNSSSDHPVVQLLGIGNEQTLFLSSTNWQSNAFISLRVTNFPVGYALATMFVNGTPSTSSIVRIGPTPASTITLNHPPKLVNGSLEFTFTNVTGGVFNALATTNVAAPLSNWTVLGNVTEIADGQFQFSDAQTTNFPRRFYRVVSP